MTAKSDTYREKYFTALEEQEQMEKQFSFQLDCMRKTLTHLASAATGLDKQLDASIISLREKIRGAPGAHVIQQMEKVQKCVVAFERSRESEQITAVSSTSLLVKQFLELALPSAIKESLQAYDKNLKQRLSSYRNYPAALEELGKLQLLAINAATNPKRNLWQRIKGDDTLRAPQQDQPIDSEKADKTNDTPNEPEPAEQPTSQRQEDTSNNTFELSNSPSTDTTSSNTRTNHDLKSARTISLVDEEDYEHVAERINATLKNLVEKIEPNDIVKHKVDIVKSRLERGLDWFALAVTLEDLRDILLQRYLEVDKEFSDYLQRVNSELRSIREALGETIEHDRSAQTAKQVFSDTVSSQVDKMRSTIQESHTLDSLKDRVDNHLTVIHDALVHFRKEEAAVPSITEQLAQLVKKVESIESESQKTKELLEEERHKATHDSLTQLPNREAYNERVYHELQRHKRYGRPLCLAVCDIDFFKRINDNYGHLAGDKVLKFIAQVISKRLREVDFIARYGGEEFVILLPETDADQAFTFLDKIRHVISETPFRFKDNPVQITISFGIVNFESNDTVESAFAKADKALYKAKDLGRNQCVITEAEPARE